MYDKIKGGNQSPKKISSSLCMTVEWVEDTFVANYSDLRRGHLK